MGNRYEEELCEKVRSSSEYVHTEEEDPEHLNNINVDSDCINRNEDQQINK